MFFGYPFQGREYIVGLWTDNFTLIDNTLAPLYHAMANVNLLNEVILSLFRHSCIKKDILPDIFIDVGSFEDTDVDIRWSIIQHLLISGPNGEKSFYFSGFGHIPFFDP
ncbi:hypothetical protein SDC9_162920 [bioreactor metagenome]|uniref:Uncharacterized protein n=1 Tax=bioreactor metagenome TaxID=1076179 RepID=A0A645FPF6_9ZZZZ